jgi:hypothetical protein
MAPFLYRCPNTGYRIQGFVAEEVSDDQTYVSIIPSATIRVPIK